MMLAAAVDCDWLEPNAPNGLAPLAVQRMLVTDNCRDRVLKWYSRLYGPHGPEALGYVGPASSVGGKLEIVDVACQVRGHNFDRYEEAPAVYQRLGWYTFLTGTTAAAAKSAQASDLARNTRYG